MRVWVVIQTGFDDFIVGEAYAYVEKVFCSLERAQDYIDERRFNFDEPNEIEFYEDERYGFHVYSKVGNDLDIFVDVDGKEVE